MWRVDVPDLVAQYFDAPRLRRLVEFADDVGIDGRAFLERTVEVDLADFTAQRRLRQLRDGELVVAVLIPGTVWSVLREPTTSGFFVVVVDSPGLRVCMP